jgi:hypothetical protein
MDQFFMGAMTVESFIVSLFFLRFYRDTRDRLFLIFSLAFALLGTTRVALALSIAYQRASHDEHQYIYLIRLAAFVLILIAIADKNRPRRSTDPAV